LFGRHGVWGVRGYWKTGFDFAVEVDWRESWILAD